MARKNDMLVCIREDCYNIDTLVMIKSFPKIDEVVQVEKVVKDEDGVWLCLIGYNEDMYDANCFRPFTLADYKQRCLEKFISFS